MSVRIRVNAREASEMLDRMAETLRVEGKLGRRVADLMREDVLRQFQAGGIDPAWKALAESTVDEKRRMGYPRLDRRGLVPQRLVQQGQFGPGNILVKTGALISSYTDSRDPHHIEEVDESSVTIGSDLPYAEVHQTGATVRKRGGKGTFEIPQRELKITDQGRQEIAELIEQAMAEGGR